MHKCKLKKKKKRSLEMAATSGIHKTRKENNLSGKCQNCC